MKTRSAQGKALLRWYELRTQQSVPVLGCVSLGFLLCAQTQKSSLSSVLFSHSLVCIPTNCILLLHLFSLGENSGGRRPLLPSTHCFLKVVTSKCIVYVDVHVYQLTEGKARLIDMLYTFAKWLCWLPVFPS